MQMVVKSLVSVAGFSLVIIFTFLAAHVEGQALISFGDPLSSSPVALVSELCHRLSRCTRSAKRQHDCGASVRST
jgi:hypothetical protein